MTGIAEKSKHDSVPYTTLTYATGPTPNFQFRGRNDLVVREDPARWDTEGKEYHQQATILTDKETHGGGDVTVYATGRFFHLRLYCIQLLGIVSLPCQLSRK